MSVVRTHNALHPAVPFLPNGGQDFVRILEALSQLLWNRVNRLELVYNAVSRRRYNVVKPPVKPLIEAVLELTTPENIAFILHRPSITIAILSDYLREVLQQQNVNLNHITYKKIYLVDLCLRIWNLPPCMEGATVMTFIQNVNLSSTYHEIIIIHRDHPNADAATAVAAATAPAAATAAAAATAVDEECVLQIDPPIKGGAHIVQQMITKGGIDLIDQEVADEGDGVTTFHAITRTTGERFRLEVSNQRIMSIRHF